MFSDSSVVPFVPTDVDDDEPVIPNFLRELKSYRYRPSKNAWKHISNPLTNEEKTYPTSVRIITWNIDFSCSHRAERLTAALRHLEQDVLQSKDGLPLEPCCILLQEVHAEVFQNLFQDDWVKKHFIVTPISKEKWPEDAYYGNITLVSRSLTVLRSQILYFALSKQQRTGLAVYIKLSAPEPKAREDTIVIVNTHLESLPEGVDARPQQLSLLSRFLKQEDVHGGVIAGDMNAIGPSDAKNPKECGLRDAWKKGDKDQSGFTWGFQCKEPFPAARLDKILYLPNCGYKVDEPCKIGVGIKFKSTDGSVEGSWASDHYGLDTTLRMVR